ncbi:MAG: AMP-binding protein [Burkholderiaceae bacterium]
MSSDTLFGLIERRCAEAPQALALQFGAQAITRGQWLERIEAATRTLRAENLPVGAAIAWLGLNSPEMLATLFACARLGLVFVPLNWRLAAPELAAIVQHAGARRLLGTPEFAALADQVRSSCPSPATAPAEAGLFGAADLLLVYTSGTTGEPKGAVHTQANVLANITAAIDAQDFDATTRVLAVLPLFHVGGLCIQVLPALAAGAAVNLHARFEPSAWLRDVAAWRPSTSLLVPAVMRALSTHTDWPAADLASLRFVNSGSSIVPAMAIAPFHARGVPVAQVYGSTETGPVSIVLRPQDAYAHVGSTGQPALNVQIRLVDSEGRDVPSGEVGEIHVKAPNVMRGYHRLPADPAFTGGWFHSGDLARRDAQGYYEVVGRAKDLIISGGENIYPAEIENIAAAWPGVSACAVVGLPDALWGEVPVLALVPAENAAIDSRALRAELAERLARFKQPRAIVVLDALPLTPLGKVRKSELATQLIASGAASTLTKADP